VAASATYIWTEEGEASDHTTDTFLLAGWFQIPPFEEAADLQVFYAISDSEGMFYIDLAFRGGIIFLEVSIYDKPLRYSASPVVVGGTAYLDDPPNHPYIQGGWNSFAVSGRLSGQVIQYMVNRQLLDPSPLEWHSTGPILIVAGNEWSVGPGRAPPGFALSDWRFSYGEPFFDLSSPGNVARLFGGGPVDWGPAGEFVTGLVPRVFLHGNSETYMDNLGSMGRFIRGDTMPLLDTPGPGYGVSGMSVVPQTAQAIATSEGIVSVTTIERIS